MGRYKDFEKKQKEAQELERVTHQLQTLIQSHLPAERYIPIGEYHEEVHRSNCMVPSEKNNDSPASLVDTDLPSEKPLQLHPVLVMPAQSPTWTICLVTDITTYAISGPWRIKGTTLDTTQSWQEVRSGAVWRKYSSSRI